MSGLWELIVSKKTDNTIYNDKDEENYTKLIRKTNTFYYKNNRETNRPKSSKGDKWNDILSDIWKNRKKYEGKGVVVIPCDPNALLER